MERKHSFSLQCIKQKGRKNRKEQYPVYLRITVGGIRTEIATNVMAAIDKWNAAKCRMSGMVMEIRQSNQLLDNFEHKAREILTGFYWRGKVLLQK